MNTYAVSIQWDSGNTLSIVQAESAEHALGDATDDAMNVRMPIHAYNVMNINDPLDTISR
jgi:hypothetical protein